MPLLKSEHIKISFCINTLPPKKNLTILFINVRGINPYLEVTIWLAITYNDGHRNPIILCQIYMYISIPAAMIHPISLIFCFISVPSPYSKSSIKMLFSIPNVVLKIIKSGLNSSIYVFILFISDSVKYLKSISVKYSH